MTVETLATAQVGPLSIILELCNFDREDEHYEVEVREPIETTSDICKERIIARIKLFGSYGEAKNAWDALCTTALAIQRVAHA